MRCKEVTCKAVFVIGDPPPAPATPPPAPPANPTRQQTGSVGDLVPLLPADAPQPPPGHHVSEMLPLLQAEELPAQEPIEPAAPAPSALSWQDAPPPRRGTGLLPDQPASTPPERKPRREPMRPAPAPEAEGGPRVFEAGSWDAPPPVQRGGGKAPNEAGAPPPARTRGKGPAAEGASHPPVAAHEAPAGVSEPAAPPQYEAAHQPRGRMAKWLILSFSVVTVVTLFTVGYFGYIWVSQAEERGRREADEQYKNGLFRDAQQRYRELAEKFPDSGFAPYYKFREELSDIRRQVGDQPESPGELIDHIGQFIDASQKEPQLTELKAHARDVSEALNKLLVDWCKAIGEPTDSKPLEVMDRARPVIDRAKAIRVADGAKPFDWSEQQTAFDKLKRDVAVMEHRNSVIKRLEKLAGNPSYRSLLAFEALVKQEEAELPGLANLPRVKNLLEALFDGHLRRVEYVRDPPPPPGTGAGEETEPTILFDPLTRGSPGEAPRGDPIVLALVRGVLYALKQSNGEVKWATRVGIDTTALPVRVPAGIGSTERILVLSSDTSTLTALDTNGRPLWRYGLGAPVLGKPVVVDQRAYLATYNGEVHEIELVAGKLVGVYRLGGRLTLGGTLEPGTKRIYFPADEGCVYVLDVAAQKCEMILYSRHPGGSLRGEPVILPPLQPDTPGYLVLNQTNGLRGVHLRVFDLPLADRQARDRALSPKATLAGWTWFRPYHDPEKLVMLSDAGVLGLFGIRQPNNNDQPLFPLLPGGGLPLAPLLGGGAAGAHAPRGRAEVVQVQGNDLWVLASDQLQRLQLAWRQPEGPYVKALWNKVQLEPLRLGAPLHRSQVVEDRAGRTSLVLVTQPPHRSICWATCVDDESGTVRWQRQLGLVCARSPLPVPMADGPPLFLALDQGGALFSIDPTLKTVKPGTLLPDAGSLDENPRQEPVVLTAEDGKSVHVLACPGGRSELVVRHVLPGAGRSLRMEEARVPLPATLRGTPAAVGPRLLLPLANGDLVRLPLPLPGGADVETGPSWRGERAVPESQGHVVAVSDDRFLTTDGGRGLTCLEWKAAEPTWATLPEGSRLDLPNRIVSAPLRLPGKPGALPLVCVADSAGVLTLVEVQANGVLQVKKSFPALGEITSGPFLQMTPAGPRIGCIVEGSRLAWLDPDGDGPLWVHATSSGEAIVGRPQLQDGMIVVADQSGRYVGLDPVSGKPLGKGYTLRGSVAPVASPVLFTKDRMLAPLSDGTILLLATARLREKEGEEKAPRPPSSPPPKEDKKS
jgi:hypothetical protein